VSDGRGGLGFAQEALDRGRVGRRRRVEELDGDEASKDVVLGLVDRAHAAVAEQAHEAVPPGDGPAD
jgi:hypothetical protein